MSAERIERLVAAFNGAIKYAPMVKDHPEWSDEACVAYAREWHARAIAQLRERGLRTHDVRGESLPRWNAGIPYCRNIPTPAMLAEAGR